MKRLRHRILTVIAALAVLGFSMPELPQGGIPLPEITASAAEVPFFNTVSAFRTYLDENFNTKYEYDGSVTKFTIYGYKGTSTDVCIPNPVMTYDTETYEARAVSVEAIAEGAFEGNTEITSVSIPASVTKIDTEGADFDTDVHEAVAMVPGMGDDKKGKVIDCLQPGYKLNDKVIRHAKVAVGQ